MQHPVPPILFHRIPGDATPAQAPPTPISPPSPDFVALTQGMQYCLTTAYEVWEGLPF